MFTFRRLYEKIGLKRLMIAHAFLVIAAIAILVFYQQTTGEWFSKSIDLKGGVQMNIDGIGKTSAEIEKVLINEIREVRVRGYSSVTSRGVTIDAPEGITEEKIINSLKKGGIEVKSYSFQIVGSSLGRGFWEQSKLAFALAFLFMGVIAFIMFRSVAPSLAVIQAALSDILITLAVMRVLGIDLSLAVFSALLLMVGYSIDTDILLTNKILRREGKFIDKLTEATRTGLTMTSTAMAAVIVMFFASSAPAIKEISSTLLIAMIADIPATWFMNAGILRWWVGRKGMIGQEEIGWNGT